MQPTPESKDFRQVMLEYLGAAVRRNESFEPPGVFIHACQTLGITQHDVDTHPPSMTDDFTSTIHFEDSAVTHKYFGEQPLSERIQAWWRRTFGK